MCVSLDAKSGEMVVEYIHETKASNERKRTVSFGG